MEKPYRAFISYSHAEDSQLAAAIHSALHRFAKPWYGLQAMRVFRDKTNMSANPALWLAIEKALEQSEWLLFFASPASAQSEWVRKELDWWLKHRSIDRLILCLSGGALAWDSTNEDFDWTITTALPMAMRGAFREEPLWVDLREARKASPLSLKNSGFRNAFLDIAAPLHGKSKDLLYSEDRRARRQLWSILIGLIFALVFSSLITVRVDQISRQRQDTVASLELASRAYLLLSTDPELSALLGLAGYARRQTGTAEVSLRHALAKLTGEPSSISINSDIPIRAIAFSPDGKQLVTASMDSPLSLYRADNGTSIGALQPAITGDIPALIWGRNGVIAAADSSGKIYLWHSIDVPSMVIDQSVDTTRQEKPTRLEISPQGNQLAVGYDSGNITLLDVATSKPISRIQGHSTTISALAFHRTGRFLASGSADGYVRIWSIATGQQLAATKVTGRVTTLAFNLHGKAVLSDELLVIGDETGPLQILDINPLLKNETTTELRRISLSDDVSIVTARFTDNGKCLLVSGGDGNTALRQINAWQVLTHFNENNTPLLAAAVGADNHYALLSARGEVNLYETAICASVNELCAMGHRLLQRRLTDEERLRFIPGKRAASEDDPLPAACQAWVNTALNGQR